MEITIKWTVDSKSDEEAKKKVKALFNAAYEDLAATPLPDWDPEYLRAKLHKTKERYLQAEMDLQNRNEEIQDLKLENDRLKQREDLYQKYLNMFDCHEITCVRCIKFRPGDDVPCNLALPQYRHKLINDLKKKLEDL